LSSLTTDTVLDMKGYLSNLTKILMNDLK
jgi:hypothetical protein